MATIPTYRDLEDRIEVLEGKLRFWSGLYASIQEEEDSVEWVDDLETRLDKWEGYVDRVLDDESEGYDTAESVMKGLEEALKYQEEFGTLGNYKGRLGKVNKIIKDNIGDPPE